MMHITLNGDAHSAEPGDTAADLLRRLDLDAGKIALEINREIVPKTAYADTKVREGDEVEIISFIGGG